MALSIIKSNVFDTYLSLFDECMCVCLCACFWCTVICSISHKFTFVQITFICTPTIGHSFRLKSYRTHIHKQIYIHWRITHIIGSFILMCWISHPQAWYQTHTYSHVSTTYRPTDVIFYLESMWKFPLLLYLEMLSISLMSKIQMMDLMDSMDKCMDNAWTTWGFYLSTNIKLLIHAVVSYTLCDIHVYSILYLYVCIHIRTCE